MDSDLREDKRKTLIYYVKESIFWIYLFFLVLYGIVMISLLASGSIELTNLKQSEAFILAEETIGQWNKNLMIDIKVGDGECPQGYDSIIQHEWAGTVAGCGCDFESQNVTQTIVVKGKCNSELLGFGCFDIPEQPPIQANNWKNGKQLCALRDSQWNMINSLDQECALGEVVARNYKKCGSGSRAVCRANTDECPISYVQNLEDNYVGDLQAEKLYINDELEYTFQKDQEGYLPIMDFRFDEYSHCLNPKQRNISPNKTGEYILLNERRENCYEEETRTAYIDTIGEEQFYKQNPQVWNVTYANDNLPGYPRPSDTYTYKLSYQPYPYWTFECRNQENLNLKEAKKRLELDNENSQEDHLIATTIISVVFVSVILVGLEVKKKYDRSKELIQIAQIQSDRKKYRVIIKHIPSMHRQWLKNTVLLIVVDKFFKIVNIFSIFMVYIELNNASDWFNDIQKNRCSDTYFNNRILETYQNSIDEMFQYISAMLGLWWFIIAIDITFLIFRYMHEMRPIIQILNGVRPRVLNAKKQDILKKQRQVHKEKMREDDDIYDDDEDEEDDDDEDDSDEYEDDSEEDEDEDEIDDDELPESNKGGDEDNNIDDEDVQEMNKGSHRGQVNKFQTPQRGIKNKKK